MRIIFIVLIVIVGVIVASAVINEITKSPLERALEDIGTKALTDPDFIDDRIDQMQQEQENKEQAFTESKRIFCEERGGTYSVNARWCDVSELCLEAGGILIEMRSIYDNERCQWSERSLPQEQEDELMANCAAADGRFVRDGSYLYCTVNPGWLAPMQDG